MYREINKNSFLELFPDVSRETLELLSLYSELIIKWQKKINLIAAETIPHLWQRHIYDAAQIFLHYRTEGCWLDLGSGAGFPGIVVAIFLKNKPNSFVHLVESNHKKSAFLQQVVNQLNLRAQIHCKRIEKLPLINPRPDFITARALTSLSNLLKYGEKWFNKGAKGLFLKGESYRLEIEEALLYWDFKVKSYVSCTEKKAVLLELKDIKRKLNAGR